MMDLQVGYNYSLAQIVKAYHADPPSSDAEPSYVLHCGDEIVALCLRHKHHPEPGEVWVETDPTASLWGERLAQCLAKKTLPLYYCPRGRSFFEFKGQHLITGDTADPNDLAQRKAPVPLSRIVFLKKA
jgi:hypothetical protein